MQDGIALPDDLGDAHRNQAYPSGKRV
jgi:hypothetical protein